MSGWLGKQVEKNAGDATIVSDAAKEGGQKGRIRRGDGAKKEAGLAGLPPNTINHQKKFRSARPT